MRGGEAEQSAREYEGKSMRGGKDRGAESATEDEEMNGRGREEDERRGKGAESATEDEEMNGREGEGKRMR